MKKKLLVLVAIVVLAVAMAATAYADMGPKPSVNITFTGIEGETYYVTLLSKYDSTGPASAWDGTSKYEYYMGPYQRIWEKFLSYEDSDGFYFLQRWSDCSESNEYRWGYYPPDTFKVLLYFPKTDTFCVSGIYETYAFSSYFTIDLSEYGTGALIAEKSYDYKLEIAGLVFRIILTVLLELGIADMYGYSEKKQMLFIAGVNIVTQAALNITLNVIHYRSGYWLFRYILMEFAVFFAEAILYSIFLHRLRVEENDEFVDKPVRYAFAANVFSFFVGLFFARLFFGMY